MPAVVGAAPDAAPVRRPEYADLEEGLTLCRFLQERGEAKVYKGYHHIHEQRSS